jgi:hypothetical protein
MEIHVGRLNTGQSEVVNLQSKEQEEDQGESEKRIQKLIWTLCHLIYKHKKKRPK